MTEQIQQFIEQQAQRLKEKTTRRECRLCDYGYVKPHLQHLTGVVYCQQWMNEVCDNEDKFVSETEAKNATITL